MSNASSAFARHCDADTSITVPPYAKIPCDDDSSNLTPHKYTINPIEQIENNIMQPKDDDTQDDQKKECQHHQ